MNKIKHIWNKNDTTFTIITDENDNVRYSLDNISYEDIKEIVGIEDNIVNRTFVWNDIEEDIVKILLELE